MNRVILESIELWQRAACPQPDQRTLSAGLGYHLEEIEEMLRAIKLDDAHDAARRDACTMLEFLASSLKQGQARIEQMDRKEVCDGIADQIVTGVGFGYRARMNIPQAVIRVDESNWSKFDRAGQPVKDSHGKVVKGPDYAPPNLEGLY